MTLRELAVQLRALVEKAAQSLDDADALDGVTLYPAWAAGVTYPAGERVRHEGVLYRCLQAHTSQAGWEPDATPALFAEAARPGEIPVWRQPTGAHDAYMAGDKVRYPGGDDPVWVSTADNNVWQPGVYGWARE